MHQERTEEPTPRRRERARAEGQAPRSQLLLAGLSLASIVLMWRCLAIFGLQWLPAFTWTLTLSAQLAHSLHFSNLALGVGRAAWSGLLLYFILLSSCIVCIVAVANAALSGSIQVSALTMLPRIRRLSLRNGLSRMLSFESAIQAASGALCVALMGGLIFHSLRAGLAGLALPTQFLAQLSGAVVLLKSLWWRVTVLLLIVGFCDLAMQRRRHQMRLRMTPLEVREDRAQSEGRPEFKKQRQALGAKRGRSLRLSAIKRASAVVTNPTHFAVALRYAPPEFDVPVVVARGAARTAAIIRDVASAHQIPIVESPELAQRLYVQVDVDDPIPEEYYAAVAAVFAWIIRTRGQLPRGEAADAS